MRARLVSGWIIAIGLALLWAVSVGYFRGGQDFRVFHHAAQVVFEGRWAELYTTGPDRYLYAPGFALLISPLGAIPVGVAHVIWLIATLAAFVFTLAALARRYAWAPVALAFFFLFRTIAIDLRYGQVNLFILSAAVAAMFAWFERSDSSRRRPVSGGNLKEGFPRWGFNSNHQRSRGVDASRAERKTLYEENYYRKNDGAATRS